MRVNTINGQVQAASAAVGSDVFDLDVSVLESSDGQAALINLTDDGCAATCSSNCVSNGA
ncbi:FxLD family lanthipeptide [Streptomyces sp. NPDC023723]|uniref:FxLD family lanthipeptide n=1 Tax=Streptomyces sp. NPDC023723 TaxID=3154323 RepID=UPI0033FB4F97